MSLKNKIAKIQSNQIALAKILQRIASSSSRLALSISGEDLKLALALIQETSTLVEDIKGDN
jgi:hypothetical protein